MEEVGVVGLYIVISWYRFVMEPSNEFLISS